MLLFMDSFDHYTTYTDKGYTEISNPTQGGSHAPSAGNGRFSTASLRLLAGFSAPYDDSAIAKALGTSYSTLIAGFAYKYTIGGDQDYRFFSFYATSTEYFRVGNYLATGELFIIRNGTTVNTGKILSAGTWYHIEVKVNFHTSTGSWEIRVNNESIMSQSSVNTGAACNAIRFYCEQGQTIDYDDFFLCDTTGTYNNDFLGDCRIASSLPSGAGTTTGLTPNTGANYAAVDEAAPDGDTTYVSGKTLDTFDTYAYTDISNVSAVKGLQLLAYAKKDDSGTRELAFMTRTASTNYTGSDLALASTYTYVSEIQEENPNTAAAWTQSQINAAEFGAKVR